MTRSNGFEVSIITLRAVFLRRVTPVQPIAIDKNNFVNMHQPSTYGLSWNLENRVQDAPSARRSTKKSLMPPLDFHQ
ncbi:hypothetical protein [Leisingera aquimarina]|uniref:hypothetical protein n=1 Tax=Leisingera aquimarina TaxID=476529 RepID=UPI0012EBC9D2